MKNIAAEIADFIGLALFHSLWISCLAALLFGVLRATLSEERAALRCGLGMICLTAVPLISVIIALQSNETPAFYSFSLSPTISSISLPVWGLVCWTIGAAISLGRNGYSVWLANRLLANSPKLTQKPILRRLNILRAKLRIGRKIYLKASDQITSPCIIGVLRPTIIVPLSLLGRVPTSYLDAVFAHELAHAKRADYLLNLLQLLIESLLFFHPAIWWLSTAIREEREFACDQAASSLLGNEQEYAEAIVAFEEARAMQATMSFREASALVRLQRLLFPSRRESLAPLCGIVGSSTVISGAVVLAGLFTANLTHANSEKLHPIEPQTRDVKAAKALLSHSSVWKNSAPVGLGATLFRSTYLIEKEGKLFDLRKTEPRLFEEFPNSWIVENSVNFLNGRLPSLDQDRDGFTTLEEYQNKTDPNSANSYPSQSLKTVYLNRERQVYRVTYSAKPDSKRFQLTRHSSTRYAGRSTFILQKGETTRDGILRIEEESQGNLVVTFLPLQKKFTLPLKKDTEIETSFAELKFNLPDGNKPFYVKEGEFFATPDQKELWIVHSVSPESCVIRARGNKIERILPVQHPTQTP